MTSPMSKFRAQYTRDGNYFYFFRESCNVMTLAWARLGWVIKNDWPHTLGNWPHKVRFRIFSPSGTI